MIIWALGVRLLYASGSSRLSIETPREHLNIAYRLRCKLTRMIHG